MEYVKTNCELYHHGIRGQRWGKKNGPPYPLDESDHSASEKKARRKKSLDGESGSETKKKPYYKSTLHADFAKDKDRPTLSEFARHPAGSFKKNVQISAKKYAKNRTVGHVVTQTVLTNIGLTGAAALAKHATRNTGFEAAGNILSGMFGALAVRNAAVGITAAVQKGRGRYD